MFASNFFSIVECMAMRVTLLYFAVLRDIIGAAESNVTLPSGARPRDVWRTLRAEHRELAGYEPCAIFRTTDDGATWQKLPVNVTFPAVSDHPDVPKRVISIAVDPANPSEIYASLEVGAAHSEGQTPIVTDRQNVVSIPIGRTVIGRPVIGVE